MEEKKKQLAPAHIFIRQRIKNIFFLFWTTPLLLCSCNPNNDITEKRPNILFILVDDQRNGLLSCEGHPIVRTPTIDLLADNGTKFTNAFVTTSICAASRASILTGLYESVHNHTFGKDPLKTEFIKNSYPLLLKKSGYRTGFIGKFGVSVEKKDSTLQQMFDEYTLSKKLGPHFIELPDGNMRHSAEVKGDQAIDFIKNQTKEKPFCLSISFNAVHAVDKNKIPGNQGHYPYPKAVSHLYENIEVPKPELSSMDIYNNHPEFLKKSLNRERYFWRWDTEEKYQKNMKAYYKMISGYDRVVKRILAALKKHNFDKNTVIVFSSDNGYYMGNRGFAGKWSHYEESLRVPLIIYDPRADSKTEKAINQDIALNIDIPATILDLAGISHPETYHGKSLLPIAGDEKINTSRTSFLCEHRMDHPKIPKYVGVRGKRYVYANYYEQNPPYEFLHDLNKDPKQLKNLSNDPDYRRVLQDMRRKCDSLQNGILN